MGTIKGWNFFPRKLSADGSTTNETLRAEKTRLEARLVEIPVLISRLQNTIKLTEADIAWLESLNNRRRKDWEKENGKDIEQVTYDGTKNVVSYKAQVEALTTEKARIPAQIEAIDRQLEAMIKGESTGLAQGLSSATSKQLGELAVKKEQDKIVHEQAVQQVELQKVTQEAVTAQAQAKKMSPQMKWGLIIGSVVVLGIIAYVIYKRKAAAAAIAATMPKPLGL